MALQAILRIILGDVVRHARDIRGVVVVLGMATVAIGGQRTFVIVDVASGAGHAGGVEPGERKRCFVVVEGRVQPVGSGVAQRAVLRHVRGDVVRRTRNCRGVVVVLDMATVAVGGQGSGVIIGVAGGAGHVGGVEAGQRKRRFVVVEGGVEPVGGGVAQRAVLRHVRGDVVRHTRNCRGIVVVLDMATVAVGRQGSGVIIGVAGGAGRSRVFAGKREVCDLIVIKLGVLPVQERMAIGAIL